MQSLSPIKQAAKGRPNYRDGPFSFTYLGILVAGAGVCPWSGKWIRLPGEYVCKLCQCQVVACGPLCPIDQPERS